MDMKGIIYKIIKTEFIYSSDEAERIMENVHSEIWYECHNKTLSEIDDMQKKCITQTLKRMRRRWYPVEYKHELIFSIMKRLLLKWREDNAFIDQEVLRTVAQLVVADYVQPGDDPMYNHSFHENAGDLMFSLKFFQDALILYDQAFAVTKDTYGEKSRIVEKKEELQKEINKEKG